MALGRDVSTIGDNVLWDEDELSRSAAMGSNSLSVTSINSLDDVRPIEGFTEPEGCDDFAFRGGPRPL